MVADALDHCGGTRVAHAEALADEAAEEDLATGGAVADHVAGDRVLLGGELGAAIGSNDDTPAGQALGDVVVGVTLEPQRDPGRHERAEALAGRAAEVDVDRAVGQTGAAVALW